MKAIVEEKRPIIAFMGLDNKHHFITAETKDWFYKDVANDIYEIHIDSECIRVRAETWDEVITRLDPKVANWHG